ncbi:hypothetical protein [Salinimicrobium soli]|uniref:hypothetical protein n=1 Tax=Salinimicrobium soli TaxID=1254399 RepID=UPI003AAB8C4F
MKTFYLKTDKFWIFSRLIFTLLLIIAVIKVLNDSGFESGRILGFSTLGIYIGLMIFILIRRFLRKPVPSAVKICTGIITVLMGFLMSYTILINTNIDWLLKTGFHFVPVWAILLGLRDIVLYRTDYHLPRTQPMKSE